ncbi:D-ribose ABC transporter substrate-binding protein [Raineyella fluvialis]|uniref:Substrate-binding domain-containing protein n=1 Tax=Raineyella fluvialis TaxID=2662261 RepID=A0A5Q2FAH9_9ACTN|nr:D-ribose ABC transporter substrate-binding protein [Raineyella fluvialis]QGF23922.1 substrate-binding domain-containing protein [Raineyella fluvialis]
MSINLTRRGLALLAATGLSVVLVAGCSGNGSPSASGSASSSGTKIAMAISTMNNPFFVSLRDGAQAEAKAKGVDLLVSDAQNDASTQLNQLSNAQTSGAKAVIVNPVDSKAVAGGVKALIGAKVPVVAVDRGVEGVDVASFIASDNVAGGGQAADALAQATHSTGKVIWLQGTPGTSASIDRGKGFSETLKKYPNLSIVATQTANFDRTQGLNVATNLLQAHPEATAIFAENDEMALGAIKALGDKAGKSVMVVGFDGTPDGIKAVSDGTMAADIAQQPAELGKLAVDQAINAVGGTAQKSIPVPVKTVTKDNVSGYQK